MNAKRPPLTVAQVLRSVPPGAMPQFDALPMKAKRLLVTAFLDVAKRLRPVGRFYAKHGLAQVGAFYLRIVKRDRATGLPSVLKLSLYGERENEGHKADATLPLAPLVAAVGACAKFFDPFAPGAAFDRGEPPASRTRTRSRSRAK